MPEASHTCGREKEIDEMRAEIGRLRSSLSEDHDLLTKLDTKFDIMSTTINTFMSEFSAKLSQLMLQPAVRSEKLFLVVMSTIITSVISGIIVFLTRGTP